MRGGGEINVYVIKAITKPLTKLMISLKNPRAQRGFGGFGGGVFFDHNFS